MTAIYQNAPYYVSEESRVEIALRVVHCPQVRAGLSTGHILLYVCFPVPVPC